MSSPVLINFPHDQRVLPFASCGVIHLFGPCCPLPPSAALSSFPSPPLVGGEAACRVLHTAKVVGVSIGIRVGSRAPKMDLEFTFPCTGGKPHDQEKPCRIGKLKKLERNGFDATHSLMPHVLLVVTIRMNNRTTR